MKAFALIFTIGFSSGSKKLIGLFSTKEKAEEKKEKHMKENAYTKHHYKIEEIEMNKEVNITIIEW